MTPEFKISKAKALLIMEQPFFASLACNMPWIRDDSVGTMATDGESVWWSGPFVDRHTVQEVKFVVCHEVMHVVWQHMYRLGQRDALRWNQATDYCINQLLHDEKIGDMPKGVLFNPQLVQAGNKLAENVYDLLPPPTKGGGGWGTGGNGQGQSNPQGQGNGKGQGQGQPTPGQDAGNGHGQPLDELRQPKGGAADQSKQQADIQVRVAQAAQAAKMCGKLSGNLKEFVDRVLRPKVDWRDVLRRFVAARAKVEASFARPKRRFIGEDIYLPSLSGERLGSIVVAVDCSGSVSSEELRKFAAEIFAIHEDLRPDQLDIVYFDSRVTHHDKYGPDDTFDIVAHGGGGTAFSPIFKFLDSQDIEPVACVVLTDLCCNDFGSAPNYPVLWVSTHTGKAPWGEIVYMK